MYKDSSKLAYSRKTQIVGLRTLRYFLLVETVTYEISRTALKRECVSRGDQRKPTWAFQWSLLLAIGFAKVLVHTFLELR